MRKDAMEKIATRRILFSNAFLGLGILMLLCFAIFQAEGLQSDPLLPAFSAFFIGCTAVLDRLNSQN